MIDVTTIPGVAPDGKTDCQPALQRYVDAQVESGQALLHFPAGAYRFDATLDLSALLYAKLQGAGSRGWTTKPPVKPMGSIVFGGFAGDLIRHAAPNTASLKTEVYDLSIFAPKGTALHIEGSVTAAVERNRISAGVIGLDMRSNCFDARVVHNRFDGPGSWAPDNIAFLACLLTNITSESNYFAGWTEGVRASGCGLKMSGDRLEVNLHGLRLGMNPEGGKHLLTGSLFSRLDFEACGTAVDVANIDNCTFELLGILGHIASPPSPNSQSQYGINDHGSNRSHWRQIQVSGGYSSCAINVNQQGGNKDPQTANWSYAQAANDLGAAWMIADNAKPNTRFTDCNQPAS